MTHNYPNQTKRLNLNPIPAKTTQNVFMYLNKFYLTLNVQQVSALFIAIVISLSSTHILKLKLSFSCFKKKVILE